MGRARSLVFKCGVCGIKFVTISQFREHLKFHENRISGIMEEPTEFKCNICHKPLKSMNRLSQHLRDAHYNEIVRKFSPKRGNPMYKYKFYHDYH